MHGQTDVFGAHYAYEWTTYMADLDSTAGKTARQGIWSHKHAGDAVTCYSAVSRAPGAVHQQNAIPD